MLKKNVSGIEKMAAGWLQYRWHMYLHSKADRGEGAANPDYCYYCGATGLIEAIGGEWKRDYWGDGAENELNNPDLYTHTVRLPSDETCKQLNFNAWEA